ncbi:two-component sensor histidine kinase/CHASE3 domain sensor protein [Devosia subaequoris]|uniref:histidine kinase n=1 Tax=Devosia subaequoris TaxID=395930 RepID=A0A7W6ILV7_9HYPH|nr:CHASE3 domain-containing protein [Devosia subaequoris]MBB4051979.1 two-component sensor histidine kinase/CHASE3 domain sensor protein [Devosia subaequoris]MCP1210143.1 CHASE3 domain-containing protein [Devosia subaequoris]
MSVLVDRLKSVEEPHLVRRGTRRLAVWVSLGLVCLAAVAALMLMQGFDRQLNDINKTYAVRNAARELAHALSQAEASQRGFLLTADPQFLQPYREAVSSLDRRVVALMEMTTDDRGQSDRVASITGDISSKMAEMDRTVELVATRRNEEAQTLTETGMGARLMAGVSATLEEFIAEEDTKLADRNQQIDQTRTGLVAALIAALTAAAILAYALLMRTQKQVSALAQRHRGLLSQNEALEEEVAERTRDIEEARAHAERERQRVEALLQDTNHRIGNSLATVSSLLALQVMRAESDDVRTALEAARLRVHAVASAHRRLRLGDDLETARADEFLAAVLEDLAETQTDGGRIAVRGVLSPIEVSARDATTLGILVGELVTNALKYAFPGARSGTITVTMARDEEDVPMLCVKDDGVGMPEGENATESGLGSVIVKQLSAQFGGEPHYATVDGGGLEVIIRLPELGRASTAKKDDAN